MSGEERGPSVEPTARLSVATCCVNLRATHSSRPSATSCCVSEPTCLRARRGSLSRPDMLGPPVRAGGQRSPWKPRLGFVITTRRLADFALPFEPTMATDEILYISMSKSRTFDIQCDVKVSLKGGEGIHWEGEKLVLPETKAGRHAEGAWTFSFEHAML